MKAFMERIDRFCYSHPNFGIPRLMLIVVIGTFAVWLLGQMDTTGLLINTLAFSPEMVFKHGQIWRLVTFIFIPYGSGLSLLLWLYFYYFIGNALEEHGGTAKFNIFYLSGALLNVVSMTLVWLFTGDDLLAQLGLYAYSYTGMHYVNLSMFFAFATLFPDLEVLFMFILPIRVKWLALLDLVLFVHGVLTSFFPLNLLPIVALLNYFLFFGGWIFQLFTPENKARRQTKANFKNEQRRIRHEMKTKAYSRKCEVCGRTDTDFPELEFRFCSRCEGYHCYCMDHINNHVHKT